MRCSAYLPLGEVNGGSTKQRPLAMCAYAFLLGIAVATYHDSANTHKMSARLSGFAPKFVEGPIFSLSAPRSQRFV